MPEWSWPLYDYAHLAGRALLGFVFISSAVAHLANPAGPRPGSPAPRLLTALVGLLLLVGALALVLGWRRFIGAGLIVIAQVLSAFVLHAFWKEQDTTARGTARVHFLNDLGLAGAALMIAYYAGWSWPFSLGG